MFLCGEDADCSGAGRVEAAMLNDGGYEIDPGSARDEKRTWLAGDFAASTLGGLECTHDQDATRSYTTPEELAMIKGSCLCGAVSFEIRGQLHSARYCHCTNCRKFSGTGYAAWGLAETSQLSISPPVPNVTKFD